jgi:hypothetical protein
VSLRDAVRLIFSIGLQPMDHPKTLFLTDVFWNTYLFIGSNRNFGEIDNTALYGRKSSPKFQTRV